ncbi:MAG: anaerobic ribonucleoside-triphosphate reductase activating protein [Clostridia bacterium]|nr:anaerobic ribonucleoside-triphosphate reductase activating protein [Clostridia bacterium]
MYPLTKEGIPTLILRGLQKTTLLDFPGQVACTVFTEGCNFSCPFCHNASLLTRDGPVLSEGDFFSFLDKRKGVLDGVAVTGGEPLIHSDVMRFLEKIKAKGYKVKLDTNGSFPGRLEDICRAGLCDYVAMDVKNAPEKYAATSGNAGSWEKCEKSISFLMENTFPFEFRTTLVKGFHTPEDMKSIGKRIAGVKRYFLQQFVDSGDILQKGLSAFSEEETKALLEAVRPYVPAVQVRGMDLS